MLNGYLKVYVLNFYLQGKKFNNNTYQYTHLPRKCFSNFPQSFAFVSSDLEHLRNPGV